MKKESPKIAILTAGGIAPCMSAGIATLIEEYSISSPSSEIIGYLNGYTGLLTNTQIKVTDSIRSKINRLSAFGGSVLGTSRIYLGNDDYCLEKGYIEKDEIAFEKAVHNLIKEKIDILNVIGGDGTINEARRILAKTEELNYDLTVVILPKTIDNDVYPISQTLGAITAAEQTALFFENIASENTADIRQLILHEVMGRHCGWLTAMSAYLYRQKLKQKNFLPEFLLFQERWDIDAIYIPELQINFDEETIRLKKKMDEKGSVNIFVSEGFDSDKILKKLKRQGKKIITDPYGMLKLDHFNVAEYLANKIADKIIAGKILIQESGYFARSASPNEEDLCLIRDSAKLAVYFGLKSLSGVIGKNEENHNELDLIELDKIKTKTFNTKEIWFQKTLHEIGQI